MGSISRHNSWVYSERLLLAFLQLFHLCDVFRAHPRENQDLPHLKMPCHKATQPEHLRRYPDALGPLKNLKP